MTEQELEYYYEGIDCTCNAYSANECACDVDWTPKEVYVLRQRIAELEKQLKPRLYWDSSDTETSYDCIEELMHIKFETGAKVGDEVEIQRAVLLTNETYVFTKIDDDDYSCEYELKGGEG